MQANILRGAIYSLLILVTGCATAYYDALERRGIEKRDILADRVTEARTEQAKAQAVFTTALDEFRALVKGDASALEVKYDDMVRALEQSTKQATEVRQRIDAIDDVGRRLFREWESELKLFESDDLRRRSQTQLIATQRDYDRLMTAMNQAADSMGPVLSIYRDQVLFLKHNLNARAISSLEPERAQIEARVEKLVDEMNLAINEADSFIATMNN